MIKIKAVECENHIIYSITKGYMVGSSYRATHLYDELQRLANIFGEFEIKFVIDNGSALMRFRPIHELPRKSACNIALNILKSASVHWDMDYKDILKKQSLHLQDKLEGYDRVYSHLYKYFDLFNEYAPRTVDYNILLLETYIKS